MTRSKRQPALFEESPQERGGPIYQGVCKQIRVLFPTSDPDAQTRKDSLAGTIAQARSLAASIDRVSGHGGGPQANGVPLATMHERLDALLERLAGTGETDPFQELLNELNSTEDTDDRAETPHTAE